MRRIETQIEMKHKKEPREKERNSKEMINAQNATEKERQKELYWWEMKKGNSVANKERQLKLHHQKLKCFKELETRGIEITLKE